jgi:hypothetical protein
LRHGIVGLLDKLRFRTFNQRASICTKQEQLSSGKLHIAEIVSPRMRSNSHGASMAEAIGVTG